LNKDQEPQPRDAGGGLTHFEGPDSTVRGGRGPGVLWDLGVGVKKRKGGRTRISCDRGEFLGGPFRLKKKK